MKRKKAKTILAVVVGIIVALLPLVGCVISTIYQIQIQQELYGLWTPYIHIWGLYDLWDLTLLGYIPIYIWCGD